MRVARTKKRGQAAPSLERREPDFQWRRRARADEVHALREALQA